MVPLPTSVCLRDAYLHIKVEQRSKGLGFLKLFLVE